MSRIERWIDLRRGRPLLPLLVLACRLVLLPVRRRRTDATRASVGFALSSRAGILLLEGSLVMAGKGYKGLTRGSSFLTRGNGLLTRLREITRGSDLAGDTVDSTHTDYTWQRILLKWKVSLNEVREEIAYQSFVGKLLLDSLPKVVQLIIDNTYFMLGSNRHVNPVKFVPSWPGCRVMMVAKFQQQNPSILESIARENRISLAH